MICIQKPAFVDFHEEFEILMPNDTKSIQNRQFLGQCEFPLEKKKKISDFDKKSGSDGVGSGRRRRRRTLFLSTYSQIL